MSNAPMSSNETLFTLDPRLRADCYDIVDLPLSRLLLLNDSRWPWLVLVPRVSDAVELFDLKAEEQQQLNTESVFIGETLRTVTACEKINLAAIGNIVRQLHVHVIARNEGDANWPGPVWGYGEKQPYNADHARKFSEKIIHTINSKGQFLWT